MAARQDKARRVPGCGGDNRLGVGRVALRRSGLMIVGGAGRDCGRASCSRLCAAARAGERYATSGLPVPRFVSLKSDKVNVRGGPDKDHDVTWVYNRAGLPVEITAEFENWRRIRDWEGAEGWVYHSLLSGKRTARGRSRKRRTICAPLLRQARRAQRRDGASCSPACSARVKRCTGTWCRFVGDGFDGWIEQERLWGVYPDEKVE